MICIEGAVAIIFSHSHHHSCLNRFVNVHNNSFYIHPAILQLFIEENFNLIFNLAIISKAKNIDKHLI
jgi:hypothetical protein